MNIQADSHRRAIESRIKASGSLVIAGDESSLVTRIVQTDPIYIEFTLPETEAAQVRARLASGSAPLVRVEVQGGAQHPEPAKLTFVDNAVEPTSGTVRARVGDRKPRFPKPR